MKHSTQIPIRGKIVQLFIVAPDEHAAFTTSLCLDASFVLAPHAVHIAIWPQRMCPDSEAQTSKHACMVVLRLKTTRTVYLHLAATQQCRRMSGPHQAFDASVMLDSTNVVFITSMYSCSSVRYDSARIPLVSHLKPTCVHPSPPLIHRHGTFA